MLRRGVPALLVAGAAGAAAQDASGKAWFTSPTCDGASVTPGYRADATNCATLGACADGQNCGNTSAPGFAPYGLTAGFGNEDVPFYTGASRFPRRDADDDGVEDPDGQTCWALEGPPKQPTYKLPMCKMYNEDSCCAPIHDAETQWSYETLVNVADRCLQYVNEEHFPLREFFCIPCDPDQHKYTSMTDSDNDDFWGEIRICKSFADRVWPQNGVDYDRCGFMIFTADPEIEGSNAQGDDKNNIVPFGDVAPDTADDPIIPSKFWVDELAPEAPCSGDGCFARGTAVEQFFNQIKPGMLDQFDFRIIDDVNVPEGQTVEQIRENCFHGSVRAVPPPHAPRAPAAQPTTPVAFLASALVF